MQESGSPSFPPLFKEDLDHVLEQTREVWEEARGQSFFITGGTGFFGVWLLESFTYINDRLNLGARATVLTRSPEAFAKKAPHLCSRPDLQFCSGDVRDFAFPEGEFTYVVHAAVPTTSDPFEMLAQIVSGTERVLEFAEHAHTRKLLLTSSGAVYGPQPASITHLPESFAGAPDPLLPASAYGEGKRTSELLCVTHAHKHGYEAKIARCFAFAGPHLPLDRHFAFGNFLRDAIRGTPIQISGDGSPLRSYLYAADLAVWLWTVLFRGVAGRAYNVGSQHDLTIAELAEEIRTTLSSASPIQIACPPDSARAPSRYVPSVERVEKELGLRESYSLQEAIRRTAQWHGRLR